MGKAKDGKLKAFLKAPGGRPTVFSDEIAETILTYINAGAYIETAAAAAGVEKKTFYLWLKKGKKYDKGEDTSEEGRKLSQFLHAVKVALARAELRDLMLIGKAAQTNWTAAAWRLERKFPDRWGRKDRLDLNTSPQIKKTIEIEVVDAGDQDQAQDVEENPSSQE